MLTASHASREGYRTPDLDGTDGRTYTLARKGETSPLLPSASAVGDRLKSSSTFQGCRQTAPSESRSRKSETFKNASQPILSITEARKPPDARLGS